MEKKRRPGRMVAATTRSTFPGPRSRIWAALEPPEVGLTLFPTAVAAGILPESPKGVGEIQYTIYDDPVSGRVLAAYEVLEVETDRRALARSLTAPGITLTVETLLEDVDDDAVRVSHRFEAQFPRGAHLHVVRGYRAHLKKAAEEIRDHLPKVLGAG